MTIPGPNSLSQSSVTDINAELAKARSKSMTQTRGPGGPAVSPTEALRDILFSIPGGAGSEFSRDLDNMERIRAGPAAGGKNPEDMSPQELHAVLWQVLTFRDSGAYMRIFRQGIVGLLFLSVSNEEDCDYHRSVSTIPHEG